MSCLVALTFQPLKACKFRPIRVSSLSPRCNLLRGFCYNLQRSQRKCLSSALGSENSGPLRRYSELLQKDILRPDREQFLAVMKLQEVYNRLRDYEPPSTLQQGTLPSNAVVHENTITNTGADDSIKTPKGLYIHGGVGSGKTVLLDLFYDCIPTSRKKRVHFHAFMLYLYSEINRWNLCCDDDEDADLLTPTETIARRLLQNSWLICFDEIQLSDYGTCSLLAGIFDYMIKHGAVVVATSNRPPENLGDSALSDTHDGEVGETVTASIASFKNLLNNQCDIFHINSETDYREHMKLGEKMYLFPVTPENEEQLDQEFASRILPGEKVLSTYLQVYGRDILVPIATFSGIARFTFKELCCTPKGPADYIQICNKYHTLFVEGIPQMNIQQKNEARRFLSFIDAAYESRTKVYCTADASPDDLFTLLPKEGNEFNDTMHMEMIGEIAYDLKLHGLDFKTLGFISGEDEIFSFKRAISRIKEMQGVLYQMATHRTQDFLPYTGSESEKQEAGKNRWVREMRRRKKVQELEAMQAERDKEVGNNEESEVHRLSTDTDWGDEASYVSWSEDILRKEKEEEKRRSLSNRQQDAPKFGEQHFWGFGWWENALKRLKGKPETSTDR